MINFQYSTLIVCHISVVYIKGVKKFIPLLGIKFRIILKRNDAENCIFHEPVILCDLYSVWHYV